MKVENFNGSESVDRSYSNKTELLRQHFIVWNCRQHNRSYANGHGCDPTIKADQIALENDRLCGVLYGTEHRQYCAMPKTPQGRA